MPFNDGNVVGDLNYTTYNGKDVLVCGDTLKAFSNFTNSLNISYDHGALWTGYFEIQTKLDFINGFFYFVFLCYRGDLWYGGSGTPEYRTGLKGCASMGGICNTKNKVSLVEFKGLWTAHVIACCFFMLWNNIFNVACFCV